MDNSFNNWSRRKFILTLSGASGALLLNPLPSYASSHDIDSRITKILAKVISIDSHNHMDVPFNLTEFNKQNYALRTELIKSGLSAICMTFCVDRPNLTQRGEAYDRFIICLDEMDELLKHNNIKRALNFTDLKEAHKKNQPIIIQSVEGDHFIEDKLERLEIAYNRGLRHLGLLHDNPSFVPSGDIYTDTQKYNGLTESGINIVKECNRLGILLDFTHASNKTINDGLEISSKPILVSHTGLNTQLGKNDKMANMMMPRLISKEQAKLIANAGGVIGVWTHLTDNALDYAQNIRAMVDVVGTNHVCIGTDTKIAPSINEKFGKNTNNPWEKSNDGFLYTVVKSLLDIGFNENEILKISGGNYCRIFDQTTKNNP